MTWHDLSYTKKGLIIGLIIGIIFGIYSNITDCHTSPGGPNGCDNNIELNIAVFEFILFFISVLTLFWVPGLASSMTGQNIIFFYGPTIFFSIVGAIIGFIISKIKSHKSKN